jgi:hypothetical protein
MLFSCINVLPFNCIWQQVYAKGKPLVFRPEIRRCANERLRKNQTGCSLRTGHIHSSVSVVGHPAFDAENYRGKVVFPEMTAMGASDPKPTFTK